VVEWSTGHPLTVFCKGFGNRRLGDTSQAIRALVSRFASGTRGIPRSLPPRLVVILPTSWALNAR